MRCQIAVTLAVCLLAWASPPSPAPAGQKPDQSAFPYPLPKVIELEKKIKLERTALYDAPLPLRGKSGQLILSEPFDGYIFPPDLEAKDIGIKIVRFLYRSRAALGEVVPASGVVIVPYGDAPAGGWPVIVWAHGTSGVGRPFAPSLMKDLYYSWGGLLQWPMLGYAVVAPDYAGLGTKVRHQYMTAPAQAQDIMNAVPAARAAVDEHLGKKSLLGDKWLAMGHSQGGTAVLCVAEMQAELKDRNYLGAISLAPVADVVDWADSMNGSKYCGYAAFLAYGIQSVYPQFKYSDILTPKAAKLMPVLDDGGWGVTLATFADKEKGVPSRQVLKAGWEKNKHVEEFRKLTALGQTPSYGPILLIQGKADETIPTEQTNALHERMLKHNKLVDYKKYDGLDHDPVIFGSFRDQVRWVQDRFADKAAERKE